MGASRDFLEMRWCERCAVLMAGLADMLRDGAALVYHFTILGWRSFRSPNIFKSSPRRFRVGAQFW